MERNSRYWLVAEAGLKNTQLFELGTQKAWQWVKGCASIRWFTDGEPRKAPNLWLLAHQYRQSQRIFSHPMDGEKSGANAAACRRLGLEVAMKIKGSQGRRRVKWVKPEHPYTARRPKTEVVANLTSALNSSIRRRCRCLQTRSAFA